MTSTTSNFEEKRRALLDKGVTYGQKPVTAISTSIRNKSTQSADGGHVTGPPDHVDRIEKLRQLRIGKAAAASKMASSNLSKIKERITIDPTSLKPSDSNLPRRETSTRKVENKISDESNRQEGKGETVSDLPQKSSSVHTDLATLSPIATHKLPSLPTTSRPKGHTKRRPPTLAKKKSTNSGEPSPYDIPNSLFASQTQAPKQSAKTGDGFESRSKIKAATSPDLKKSHSTLAGPPKIKLSPNLLAQGQSKLKHSTNLNRNNNNHNELISPQNICEKMTLAFCVCEDSDVKVLQNEVVEDKESIEKALLVEDLTYFDPVPAHFNFIDD